MVSEGSGKVGGVVMARNRSGLYLRGWAKPTNPNTGSQQRARADFSLAVAAWASLDGLQKEGWKTYADNVAMVNRLGDTIYLTGQQQFIRSYSAMSGAGLTPVLDPPTVFSLPDPGDITVAPQPGSPGVGGLLTTFDDTAAWCSEDGAALLVLQSREQSVGRNYFKGPYQLAGTVDGDSVAPVTSPFAVPNVFTLTDGNKCFAQYRLIRADGRVSTPVRVGGIIATP
jgi:hypothetical protein